MSTLAAPPRLQHPYELPRRLPRSLAHLIANWRGLMRGGAQMPFADDLNLRALAEMQSHLFLLDVFERPQRFRFDMIGDGLSAGGLAGLFLDEAAMPGYFEFLASQCAATTECRGPTFYRSQRELGYSRLLLPMWGEGRISLILGAVQPD